MTIEESISDLRDIQFAHNYQSFDITNPFKSDSALLHKKVDFMQAGDLQRNFFISFSHEDGFKV